MNSGESEFERSSQAAASMTFSLANGADNVSVYVSFFTANAAYVGVILASYMALLPIWCLAGKWLGGCPIILRSAERSGHWIVPIIFVGVGLYKLI
jgi:cadmium resistance protein CadD (predicted permease)